MQSTNVEYGSAISDINFGYASYQFLWWYRGLLLVSKPRPGDQKFENMGGGFLLRNALDMAWSNTKGVAVYRYPFVKYSQ